MSQPSPDAKAVVRAAEALTTQVRRIADALSTTAVRYEVAAIDDATTPDDGPRCVCGDHIEWWTGPGDSAGWIHRPLIGSAPLTVHQVRLAPAADDGPTTPATTCSARYAGALVVGDCIRAAGHISDTDHTDASGRHYGEKLAVYPTDSTVSVAHWHPVAEQLAGERQELAGMVGAFVDAQVQHARAAEDRLPCPYCGDRQLIPRPQLVEHIARLHPDVKTEGPAADEDAQRTARRESLRNLLDRLDRSTVHHYDEAQLLRQHVETDIREADTARAVAAGNKRHVQIMYGELTAAQAAIKRVRAECQAIAHQVYGQHDEDDDGMREAVGRVIAALDGTEQPTT